MKYYLIRYNVNDNCPDYIFVIQAATLNKAYKVVDKILKEDYPEEYSYNNNYSLCEVTKETLLNNLLIN